MSWRDHIKVHPAADLFPMMSESELRELGEDIKTHGLKSHLKLHKGKLPDGRNRLAAMELAGVEVNWSDDIAALGCPFDHLDERVDPYDYVISANLQRRHLTSEQKRELIDKVLKAKPEQSDATIAKQTKTSDKTVAKRRHKLESTSEIPKLKKTVGKDGKKRGRPAKRKAGLSPPRHPQPEPVEHRVTSSQEVDIEQRKADMAALADPPADDLSIPPVLDRTNDETTEPAPKPDAEKSLAALDLFKNACRTWLPNLTDEDLERARQFFDYYARHRSDLLASEAA